MQLSRREIELVVEELRPFLVPSRLQRVFEANPRRLVLQWRAPGVTHHLMIAAETDDTRLHLVERKPDQPAHPSPFTMQLRKWLHGAWLDELTVDEDDRVVRFYLRAIDPDWTPVSDDEAAPRIDLVLVAELLGRHPNLILLDNDDRIIGTATGSLLGQRDASAGAEYSPPPPPPEWADDEDVRPILQELEADGSRSDVLADYFQRSRQEREQRDLRKSLSRRLKRRVKKLRRRIGHIESDLQRIDDADEYRRRGELLQSAYGSVEPGASSVKVPDFYDEDMPEVEIPLDPACSLQENIERYFHDYRRLTRARDRVESRLLETMEMLDAAESAREELQGLESVDDLRAFAQRMEAQGILRPRSRKGRRGPRHQKPLPPYREFRSRRGRPILVGRSAKHNDALTTSVARGRDIWLHARDWAGAHVVLRMRKSDDIDGEDLLDAATLAAHFSEGRRDTAVDVTYTQAKYVRKPSNAPPGLVTHAGGSTLGVRIEKKRLQRLLDSEVELR